VVVKQVSTIFLRLVLVLLGAIVLTLGIFWLPGMSAQNIQAVPETAHMHYPFLAYIYIGTLPFFFAIYQALQILGYIDKSTAFSDLTVQALRNIKYCALAIIAIIAAGEVYLQVALGAGHDGIVLLGAYTIFATIVIAAFAAVLQKLVQSAVAIKKENDLTV
jgi:hypothetical protein